MMNIKLKSAFVFSIAILWMAAESFSQNQLMHMGMAQISADSLMRHVDILGSDACEGRGTGQPGGRRAMEYIARYFEKLRLEKTGDDQSYYQKIPMHGSRPMSESQLLFFNADRITRLELGDDYLLYNGGAQTFIPQPLPMVFVGYGIIAPEFDYDDYQSLDVEGKIVVFLSGEPPSDDPEFFHGGVPTIYSYPESKQRIAMSRGARGSIMIPLPREARHGDWNHWVNEFNFEQISLPYAVTANLSIVMNPQRAGKLFENDIITLEHIFLTEADHTLKSFLMKGRISFRGEFIERDFFDANVIGMLRGRNDSYLIISAHYDHLGIGPVVQGDSIYNGVGDNAIGVAAVMELARVFTLQSTNLRHSLLFLLTSGEEKGLLGATYYLDHPIIPLYKTIANLNIDGLAMFDRFTNVIGIGAEFSTLMDHLKKIAAELKIHVSNLPLEFTAAESFARSDQIAFAKAGIPSILIAEGYDDRPELMERLLHWLRQIYHTPFDDLQQPIDHPSIRQHCQILYAFSSSLANSRSTPKWHAGTPYINARLVSIAEKR